MYIQKRGQGGGNSFIHYNFLSHNFPPSYIIIYIYILINIAVFTRKDYNIISDFLVSDFISDHRALHACNVYILTLSETDISQSN